MAMSVKQQQWQLWYLGYSSCPADGIWGKQSENGMRRFQAEYGLQQTGQPNEMFADKSKKVVKAIQEKLKQDGLSVATDGLAGPSTEKATKTWQGKHGLTADGQAGPNTRAKMFDGKASVPHKPSQPVKPSVPQGWEDVKYFSKNEFRCHCGGRYCNGFPVEPNLKLAHLLDQIREHFGKPVIITSPIRCPQHNAIVGGVSNSQHLYGNAADIQVQGVAPSVVADYVETLMPTWGGIGRYKTFTHVDVRPNRSRWYG